MKLFFLFLKNDEHLSSGSELKELKFRECQHHSQPITTCQSSPQTAESLKTIPVVLEYSCITNISRVLGGERAKQMFLPAVSGDARQQRVGARGDVCAPGRLARRHEFQKSNKTVSSREIQRSRLIFGKCVLQS